MWAKIEAETTLERVISGCVNMKFVLFVLFGYNCAYKEAEFLSLSLVNRMRKPKRSCDPPLRSTNLSCEV
jgi:hypothetical protein